jgi:hypothetical protein
VSDEVAARAPASDQTTEQSAAKAHDEADEVEKSGLVRASFRSSRGGFVQGEKVWASEHEQKGNRQDHCKYRVS